MPNQNSVNGSESDTEIDSDYTSSSQLLYVMGLLFTSTGIAFSLFFYQTTVMDIPVNAGIYIIYLGVGLTASAITCGNRIDSVLD